MSEVIQTKQFWIVDRYGNKRIVSATRTIICGGSLELPCEWLYKTEDGLPVKLNWPGNSYCVIGENEQYTTTDPNAPEDPLEGYYL